MLLNQTDLTVDEELEKAIITIYSSTETDIRDNESGYEYSSGETAETSIETEACLQLGLRVHTVPNVEFCWNYVVHNAIRWNLIESL